MVARIPPAHAQVAELDTSAVTIEHDGVVLAGTLLMPRSSGRRPAMVFLHGSGPATRAGARMYAERFAALGFASLIFDKRGTGASTGSWLTASLEDLAEDALAVVRWLRNVPDIDDDRVGFWGVSQAGWVATRAAARDGRIGFLVVISGGGVSPRESESYGYQQAFERAALPPEQVADARRVIQMYFEYLATGDGRARLEQAIDSARNSRWFTLARLDRVLPDSASREAWSWVASYHPAADIARLSCPVLLLFGAQDNVFPSARAAQEWTRSLALARNSRARIETFAAAGHGIRVADYTGPGRPPFAAGYFETMERWLAVISGAKR